MEDSLWPVMKDETIGKICFVLILVVMEDSLWQDSRGSSYIPYEVVLILVVMEDSLWLVGDEGTKQAYYRS